MAKENNKISETCGCHAFANHVFWQNETPVTVDYIL
jgi:hypothetical protein